MQVRAYFPRGVWYSLWDDSHVDAVAHGVRETLAAPLGHVPVHVRGGAVVAMQRAAPTTTEVRGSPLTLVVALAPEVAVPALHNSDTARSVFAPFCAPAVARALEPACLFRIAAAAYLGSKPRHPIAIIEGRSPHALC